MRKLKLPIPTTIITGSLGVGKTTALCSLVARKPPQEHWCMIVNEFGAVGIDAVALQSSAAAADGSVTVKQIAGGCMCCAQSGVLLPAIAQIIRATKPDRLLIEPSGLGHPAGLLDILQGPHLGTSLQLNAIVCLVDLSAFDPALLAQNPTAWDQISIADVLVGSKADAATPAAAAAFQTWASNDLFPPKAQVLLSAHGDLDISVLSAPRSAAAASGLLLKPQTRSSRARQQQQAKLTQQQQGAATAAPSDRDAGPAAAAAAGVRAGQGPAALDSTSAAGAVVEQQQQLAQAAAGSADADAPTSQPQPGSPVRVMGQPTSSSSSGSLDPIQLPSDPSSTSSSVLQHSSCGWVFHESDVFDRQRLLELLQVLHPVVARIKGVFRVGLKHWVMPAAAALAAQPMAAEVGPVSGTADARRSSTSNGLQLQEVCYRGPSMVEVILSHSQQLPPQATAEAAAVERVLSALSSQAAPQQQQQAATETAEAVAAALQQVSVSGEAVWQQLEGAFQACLIKHAS